MQYPGAREALWVRQAGRLNRLIGQLRRHNPFWRQRLTTLSPDPIHSPEDLERIPLLEKDELIADQEAAPPYGTNLTYPLSCYVRIHQTSGTTRRQPLRWLDTPDSWAAFVDLWVEIFRVAGVRSDDRLLFPFSFGPFIGFWGAFEAAQRLRLFSLAAGGMTSRARLDAIFEHRITVLACTPTYALHLAEVARNEGLQLRESPVRLIIVAGEPGGSVPGIRDRIEEAWGATVKDHWGMTEVGALGIECPAVPRRMHLIEEACIAEVIDPNTQRRVSSGEGELVITTLWRPPSPVLRYRTGDMVRLCPPEPCPCGSIYVSLDGGILGRRDQMIFIRGNNVYPAALEAAIREVEGIAEFRVTVDQRQPLVELQIEVEPLPTADPAAVTSKVEQLIRDRFHFRPIVKAVAPGDLPRYELKARRLQFLR